MLIEILLAQQIYNFNLHYVMFPISNLSWFVAWIKSDFLRTFRWMDLTCALAFLIFEQRCSY